MAQECVGIGARELDRGAVWMILGLFLKAEVSQAKGEDLETQEKSCNAGINLEIFFTILEKVRGLESIHGIQPSEDPIRDTTLSPDEVSYIETNLMKAWSSQLVYYNRKAGIICRQWDAEPTKALILGKHTVDHVTVPGRTPPKYPRRAERESFEIIYRLFPRFYDCTFEEFMSPKYQLELDCSENSRVTLEDGAQVHDPFPSKGFSENMRCLMTQNVWMGNLDLLATCIHKFFETWQDVIKSAHHEQSIQDIFSQVKDLLDQKPGFYGAFFEQIGESVRINCQDRVAYNSKRTHDDDPYFIRVIDLTILIHALDNVGFWGMPFFRGASLSSGIIQQAKRGNDYPPDKKFSKAREYSVLSHRIVKRAAELEAAAQSGASES
ncbi:hypothetical protein GL218_04935 [Daldinia childiae]|uniref:uncharacterized protein n=1 Tax=Daldinia childiae TaxID=326645 RepID=UPI001445C2B4|nr:uncharacterized protein GL218_04935 [Daldinia childiae]KAF3059411.1 hypothetical protein GL218_04935 [Daldinia childiae]